MLASRSPLDIWLGSARDVHPPLYYEILHFWTEIFGNSVLSVRSLSLVAGIVVVWLGYQIAFMISKKRNVALLAGLLLSLNPFLIRYSQEVRMYGILGVFLLIAIIGLIKVSKDSKDWFGYVLYVIGVSAGLYTHYFTAMVVIAFWIYIVSIYFIKNKIMLITNWRWWLANILALLIFLPWVPSMIAQFTRAQGLGWLSKTSIRTLNDTVWQFITFTDARQILILIYWLVPILILGLVAYVCIKDRSKEKFSRLLALFTFLPLIMAILISFIRPVFHERYFVFSAIGLCLMMALAIYYIFLNNKYFAISIALIIVLIQLVGIRNVYAQSNHQMSRVMEFINQNYQTGDKIISGELYVYFDGSYYNKTGSNFLLYTGNGRPNGYGESGLIYDKNVYLDNLRNIPGGRVWILGKTGDQSYYKNLPSNWKLIETTSAGYSEARLYQIQ
ncbi:membrane protein [Candidatus Saccharibacteria bacterium]|nr:membrane protein [Candidatus Saccharibacteria bacterium]